MRLDFCLLAISLLGSAAETTVLEPRKDQSDYAQEFDSDGEDLWKRKGGGGRGGGRGRGSSSDDSGRGRPIDDNHACQDLTSSTDEQSLDRSKDQITAHLRNQSDRSEKSGSQTRRPEKPPIRTREHVHSSSDPYNFPAQLDNIFDLHYFASSFLWTQSLLGSGRGPSPPSPRERWSLSPTQKNALSEYPTPSQLLARYPLRDRLVPYSSWYGGGSTLRYGGGCYRGNSTNSRTCKLMTATFLCSYGLPMAAAAFGALDVLRVSTGIGSLGTSAAVIPLRTAEHVPQIAWISNYVAWAACFVTYLSLQTLLIPSTAIYQRRLYFLTVILAAVHFTISMSQGFEGVGDGFALYGPLVSTACAYLMSLLFSLNRPSPGDSASAQLDRARQAFAGTFCV